MEKNELGISEGNLIAIGVATFLLLFFVNINLDGTIERILYFFGIPIATGYIFSVIGKDLNEEKDNLLGNVLMYVIGALVIALFINNAVHEKDVIKACNKGNEDACETLEYWNEQRE